MRLPQQSWQRAKGLTAAAAVTLTCGGCMMLDRSPVRLKDINLPDSATLPETRAELHRHVAMLADTIGERHAGSHHRELQRSADYIQKEFEKSGYAVSQQPVLVNGKTCFNLEAVLSGSKPDAAQLVIGAHYDSVEGSPGANDNASGVAALLVAASRLKGKSMGRPVRFVAFTNEEPPYFQQETMGSLVYAKGLEAQQVKVDLMISLETMGYFSTAEGSQAYPFPLNLLLDPVGDFIGVVGRFADRKRVKDVVTRLRQAGPVPVSGGALPSMLPGVGWSDHWSFWQAGFPALMLTDTAPFRYRHYHLRSDTIDKIDFDLLARVVESFINIVPEL